MLKKDRVAHYLEKAERLEYIIPNFDPANGDMILVFKTEDASGGRSFRLSPELAPSSVPIFSRRFAKRRTDNRSRRNDNGPLPSRWRAFTVRGNNPVVA
ncbi:hypothetical protein [Mesorhizobium sp.]|uniref:hypothetical protein n=1 Tax=Mesorhizobium sp. TaxID=1871066 RepID=UPI00120260D8|nr:hypothetical protein [Mesorhizobium sp.]TIL44521.1 MAG: hypothetical protein E5Y86_16435 [Mesorhizobium sp.]